MKNIKLMLVILLASTAMACRRGPRVVIVNQSNNSYTKLEYVGRIALNSAKTQITNIGYGGYVNFNRNNDELYISTGKDGKLFYELNGDTISLMNNTGRSLLTQAIGLIAKAQGGH